MKKVALLSVGLIAVVFWVNAQRNELAVWFNSESFYRPIFKSDFDVLQIGHAVRAELKASYDVRHGFFLTFPCDNIMSRAYDNLDGSIRYSLYSDGVELESESITIPQRPIMGQNNNGICDMVLFTFNLPYKGYDTITLEVLLESPITGLAPYQENLQCEVSPAYWPK